MSGILCNDCLSLRDEGGQAASHHLLHYKKVYCSLTWFTAAPHGLLHLKRLTIQIPNDFLVLSIIGRKKTCYDLDN